MSLFTLDGIVGSLLQIGVNLTDRQLSLLKWRLSDDAQKYYSELENRKFYEALKNGDTSVVDAIRKEKQNRINNLKKSIQLIILSILSLINISCAGINTKTLEEKWDENSLTEADRTYQITDKKVVIDGDLRATKFEGKWFVVNEDLIKDFNQNQDDLISSLEKIKKLERDNIRNIIISIVSSILIMLIVTWLTKQIR